LPRSIKRISRALGVWRGILLNLWLRAGVDDAGMATVPPNPLDARNRHVAWEISLIDGGCHINSRKQALEPLDKGAELDAGQKKLIRLSSHSDNVATSIVKLG
jgi:hypothetical protein